MAVARDGVQNSRMAGVLNTIPRAPAYIPWSFSSFNTRYLSLMIPQGLSKIQDLIRFETQNIKIRYYSGLGGL